MPPPPATRNTVGLCSVVRNVAAIVWCIVGVVGVVARGSARRVVRASVAGADSDR